MKDFKTKLSSYKRQLEMMEGVLMNHNMIITVGAYTVGTDDQNRTILEIVDFPSQFTGKSTERILNQCVFKGKDGKPVSPKVYHVRDWYREQVEALETIVEYYFPEEK